MHALIKAVLFDLGDTLIDERVVSGRHLWEGTLHKLPFAQEVLSELKMRGYKLGLVTNTVTSREAHVRTAIRRIGLEQFFDAIITSVDLGFPKPDPRIFLTALRELEVKPEEAVMVGNRIDTDILGGNQAGMKTILLKWNERHQQEASRPGEAPTRTISSLTELPKALSEL